MKLWTLSLAILVVFLLGLPARCQDDAEAAEPAVEGASEAPAEEGAAEEGASEAPAEEGAAEEGASEAPAEEGAAEEGASEAPAEEGAVEEGASEAPAEEGAAEEGASEAPAEEGAAEEGASEAPAEEGAAEEGASEAPAEEGAAEGASTEEVGAAGEPTAGVVEVGPDSGTTPAGEDAAAGEPAAATEAVTGEAAVVAGVTEAAAATQAATPTGGAVVDADVTDAPVVDSVTGEGTAAAPADVAEATSASGVTEGVVPTQAETDGDVVRDMTTQVPDTVAEATEGPVVTVPPTAKPSVSMKSWITTGKADVDTAKTYTADPDWDTSIRPQIPSSSTSSTSSTEEMLASVSKAGSEDILVGRVTLQESEKSVESTMSEAGAEVSVSTVTSQPSAQVSRSEAIQAAGGMGPVGPIFNITKGHNLYEKGTESTSPLPLSLGSNPATSSTESESRTAVTGLNIINEEKTTESVEKAHFTLGESRSSGLVHTTSVSYAQTEPTELDRTTQSTEPNISTRTVLHDDDDTIIISTEVELESSPKSTDSNDITLQPTASDAGGTILSVVLKETTPSKMSSYPGILDVTKGIFDVSRFIPDRSVSNIESVATEQGYLSSGVTDTVTVSDSQVTISKSLPDISNKTGSSAIVVSEGFQSTVGTTTTIREEKEQTSIVTLEELKTTAKSSIVPKNTSQILEQQGSTPGTQSATITTTRRYNGSKQPEPGPPCESYKTIEDDARHFSNEIPPDRESDYLCDKNITEGWYAFKHQGESAVIPTVCILNTYCSAQLPWRVELSGSGLPAEGKEAKAALCSMSHILQRPDCCVIRRATLIRNCSGIYIYYLSPPDRCSVSVCTMLPGEEIPYEILGDPPILPTTEEPTEASTADLPVIDVNDLTDTQMEGTATLEFKYPEQPMDEDTMLEFDRKFRKMLADMLNQLYPELEETTAEPDTTAVPTPIPQATEVVDSNVDIDSIPNVEAPEPVGPVVPDIDPDAGVKGPLLRRKKQASSDRYTPDDVRYVGPTPRERDGKLQVAVIVDEDDDGNVVEQERLMAALQKLNETGQLAQLQTNLTLLGIYPGLPEDMSPREDDGNLWEEHKGLFITLIVLAIICLIVIIVGLCCIKCRERGSWGPNKDQDTARIHDPNPRKHPQMEENPIPDDEITKDEAPMVERENPALNGHQPISKRDEDNGWVVPIDQLSAVEKGRPEVEDTKL